MKNRFSTLGITISLVIFSICIANCQGGSEKIAVQPLTESDQTRAIRMDCDALGESSIHLQNSDDIQTYLKWAAATSDQISDFIDAVEHSLFVDDIQIESPVGFGDIEYLEDKAMYAVESRFEVGNLSVGEHSIRTLINFKHKIFDGFDWFGPGTGNSIIEGTCTVVVQDSSSILADQADIIFFNGQIITIEPSNPYVEALAVKGNAILGLGSNEDIFTLQGENTKLVDLNGKALLPGFIDGHTHVLIDPDIVGLSLNDAVEAALSYGLTTINEMAGEADFIEQLQAADQEGWLRIRVNVFTNANYGVHDGNGNAILVENPWFRNNKPLLDSHLRVRVPGVKIFLDGGWNVDRGCPAFTVAFPQDFQNSTFFQEACTTPKGTLYLSQEVLNQMVLEAQGLGYRVSFHAMGDRAIDSALDAIENALSGESNEKYRHTIQHSSYIRPDQISRYEELNILASVRGYFNTCEQEDYASFLGNDRIEWAFNRYILPNIGIHAYGEGDFGWTTDHDDFTSPRPLNPILTLYGLVTHQQLRSDGTVCQPLPYIAQQKTSVDQALRMLTIEPAYAVSQENVIGSLVPGKFADLIILSANPLTVDPDLLKDLHVWMTMVAGKTEYCAAGHEDLCP